MWYQCCYPLCNITDDSEWTFQFQTAQKLVYYTVNKVLVNDKAKLHVSILLIIMLMPWQQPDYCRKLSGSK